MTTRVALFKDRIRKTGRLVPYIVRQNIMQFAETLADQLAGCNQVRTPLGTFAMGIHWPVVDSPDPADPAFIGPRIYPETLTISLRTNRALRQPSAIIPPSR